MQTLVEELVKIHTFYSAFNYIIKMDELSTFLRNLSKELIHKQKTTQHLEEETKSFLKQFIPKMKDTGSRLAEHLIQEKNSDADIIGMIK